MTAARLGELWGTNPLDLLDVTEHEWLILLACATVVENDRRELERKRK
jgi:hypothetical protein